MFNPNNLTPSPSPSLSGLLWIPHMAALSLVISCSAPTLLKTIAGLAVVLSALHSTQLHGLLNHPRSVIQLHFDTSRLPGACEVWLRRGERLTADILAESVVTASFILLRIQPHSRDRARLVILSRWNCEAEALRKLRVQLRFQGANPSLKAAALADKTDFLD